MEIIGLKAKDLTLASNKAERGKAKHPKDDFRAFQKYFKEYQRKFGLTGYKTYFKFEPLNDCFANITVNQNDMIATVRLNSRLPDKDKPHKDIKRNAKHEAIHLLLFRLEHRACSRYVLEEEIYEAVEELVFKLEDLIE
jgi:hypothetical protein